MLEFLADPRNKEWELGDCTVRGGRNADEVRTAEGDDKVRELQSRQINPPGLLRRRTNLFFSTTAIVTCPSSLHVTFGRRRRRTLRFRLLLDLGTNLLGLQNHELHS